MGAKQGEQKGQTGERQRERKGQERNRAGKRKGQTGERQGQERNQVGKGKNKIAAVKFSCSVQGRCGGCQLLHLDYETQLQKKQELVEKLLEGICQVEPIVGMKEPFHYRNKVHAVFDLDRNGNIISGVYEEGTHRVVPVEKCLIEDERADAIIGTIRKLLPSFKLMPYLEDSGHGFLRHVLIRSARQTGEIMVVLVTGTPIFPSKNNFIKTLKQKHPEITTIILNVNAKRTSMVLGDREQVLYGRGFIIDQLCGMKFAISAKSFYQVNPVQTEILYQMAVDFAGLSGTEHVLDAYCGIGTIGLIASPKARSVIGVELNGNAVKDARSNAKHNGVGNIRFYEADAGLFMRKLAAEKEVVEVVFMDPPRAGSDKSFMDSLAVLKPMRVVYISCNPETLARDLRYLMGKGYEVERAVPVDMFPGTGHVEVVIQMTFCGSDKKNKG